MSTLAGRRIDAGVPVQCDGLAHVYHVDGEDVVALRSLDLFVRPGESVAVVGPSGSGKSTLLTLLAGLLRPTSGRLFVAGDDIARMSERELLALRANRIGVVVQRPTRNLLPYATAVQNVQFAQRGVPASRRTELPSPRDLLDRVGLGTLADRRVGALSGGEQQRVAIAVGLANAPGLLLADEPTSQVDAANRDAVVELLAGVTGRFGTTLVTVTHDAEVAAALGRVVTLHDGEIVGDAVADTDHVVVGPDGTVRLPPDVLRVLQPGRPARVIRRPEGVELRRESP